MNTDRFKFRVWDSEIKQYLKYHEGHEDYFYITGGDGHLHCDCFGTPIIEQCTGIRDKNGKLIYEGDIVNLLPVESPLHENRIVVWIGDSWSTIPKGGSGMFWDFGQHEIEIVGNIHEGDSK